MVKVEESQETKMNENRGNLKKYSARWCWWSRDQEPSCELEFKTLGLEITSLHSWTFL